MFTNRSGCTIYERTVQNRSPTFIRHEVGAIYWEDKISQENGSDRKPENHAFISIPITAQKPETRYSALSLQMNSLLLRL